MRVDRTRVLALLLAAGALGVAACESKKSANPLSPSVAGPIPGVEITAPKPLEPGVDWEVSTAKQPLTLLIENAGTTGVRPLKLDVELAADRNFASKLFTKVGVAPGPNGRTEVRLPDRLTSDRTYYWRVRAQDGANTGPWSSPVKFSIFTPVVIHAPQPRFPINGEQVADGRPVFRIGNASRTGPAGPMRYRIEIAASPAFSPLLTALAGDEEGGGETTLQPNGTLPGGRRYFWRVRGSDGKVNGAWSSTESFVTPATVAPAPGGNPGNCASKDGRFIVNCISAKYAWYRRAGVSHSERKQNMAFLRDRIIEAGLCGGLNLGWNLKRGGPELSIDFIAEKRGSLTYGYDIGIDYDNTSKELQLYWGEDGPGSHFKAFPNPNCNR